MIRLTAVCKRRILDIAQSPISFCKKILDKHSSMTFLKSKFSK